jgi:FixJ family two-component response regulator
LTSSVEIASRTTVYVVDDDPAIRQSLSELITSIGSTPECFRSAEEFLESYDPSRRGCLVVDVRLPGMSGMELQRQLAEDEASIPVVVITGHADVAMCAEAMKRGAVDFLEKPYRGSQLRESIQRAIQIDEANRSRNASRAQLVQKLEQLAPKEMSVLKGLLQGKQNKEIAAALDISLRTVQLRRSRLLRKMGVESIPELFALLAPVWRDDFQDGS